VQVYGHLCGDTVEFKDEVVYQDFKWTNLMFKKCTTLITSLDYIVTVAWSSHHLTS